MNANQIALIKKDIRSIVSNKQTLAVMLIVPIVLTIVLPSIYIIGAALEPESISEFQVLLDMLPVTDGNSDNSQFLWLLLNKLMPIFFLIIPIMSSSVMAASSFVGEKEKHTLETLLYSPLSLKQLFHAKILAGFSVGMAVSYISFAAMMLLIELEAFFMIDSFVIPDIGWLVIMLLIAPAISLAGIAITVRSSAKARTVEEAQQRAVFLVFPLIALIIGQFSGILLIGPWLMLGLGVILAALDVLLMRKASASFTYENMLI